MPKLATASKSSAQGQYLGFSLQPVRLCFHLLTCKVDSSVSIEHVDDITVHNADGTLILEQTKSALSQNPVSDWANDLWKTFANWIDQITEKNIDPATCKFRLYVTPKKTGNWVQKLSNSASEEDANAVVEQIQTEFNKLTPRPACAKYLKKLFSAPPEIQRQLIVNFEFQSEDDDPVDPIRKVLSIVSSDMVDPICEYGIGNAKEKADSLIRAKKIPIINAKAFRDEFRAFVKKHDLQNLLTSIAGPPDASLIQNTLDKSPVFVRQLHFIELPLDAQIRAVSDYLQSSAAKTEWADRGLIVRKSLEECDEDLIAQYHFRRNEIEDVEKSLDAKIRGRLLFSRCGQIRAKLESREVPGFFVPGCFNALADVLKIGWHPDYGSIFSSEQP